MDNLQNQIPSRITRGNREETSENRCRVLVVEVVVEPVVVPVPLTVVPVQIPDVRVAVRVAVHREMPSMTLPLDYSWD